MDYKRSLDREEEDGGSKRFRHDDAMDGGRSVQRRARVSRRDVYQRARQAQLLPLARGMGICSVGIAKWLREKEWGGDHVSAPPRNAVATAGEPGATPEERALDYVCPDFKDEESALRAACQAQNSENFTILS